MFRYGYGKTPRKITVSAGNFLEADQVCMFALLVLSAVLESWVCHDGVQRSELGEWA